MRRVFAFVLVSLAGCASNRLALDEQWLPLKEVVEVDSLPLNVGPHKVVLVLGTTLLTSDISIFTDSSPLGPIELHALLLHEQMHALRQADKGFGWWLGCYLFDPGFAWEEEQLAWAAQLRYLALQGRLQAPETYARTIASYPHLSGNMIDYDTALQWVRHVLGTLP